MKRIAMLAVFVLGFVHMAYGDSVTVNFNIGSTLTPVPSVATLDLVLNSNGTIGATLTGETGFYIDAFGFNNTNGLWSTLSGFSPYTPSSPNTNQGSSSFGTYRSGFADTSWGANSWTFTITNACCGPFTSVFDIASLNTGFGAPFDHSTAQFFISGFHTWNSWEIYGGNAPDPLAAVPEPATAALMLSGLLGIAGVLRRRIQ